MCYFAVQFEKFPEVTEKFQEGEIQKRQWKVFFLVENQCIPAKNGEYYPLLLLIGFLRATYPLGMGPSSFS